MSKRDDLREVRKKDLRGSAVNYYSRVPYLLHELRVGRPRQYHIKMIL